MTERGGFWGEVRSLAGHFDEATAAPLEVLLERHDDLRPISGPILAAFNLLISAFEGGHKVLVCGNGGSAADSAHIVGELMKGMTRRRPLAPADIDALQGLEHREMADYLLKHLEGALPAIDLSSQSALLAAIGNDTAGDMGFAQQVQGYGQSGDVLWALSTSGRSRNVLLAAEAARAKRLAVLAFTGPAESPLAGIADVAVHAPGQSVQEIQEVHLSVYHALCEMVELRAFR
jgi:D-sedoheptulose 7-phosphate isomerase